MAPLIDQGQDEPPLGDRDPWGRHVHYGRFGKIGRKTLPVDRLFEELGFPANADLLGRVAAFNLCGLVNRDTADGAANAVVAASSWPGRHDFEGPGSDSTRASKSDSVTRLPCR